MGEGEKNLTEVVFWAIKWGRRVCGKKEKKKKDYKRQALLENLIVEIWPKVYLGKKESAHN